MEQVSNELLDALVEKVMSRCKSSVDSNFVDTRHSECSTQTESTKTSDKYLLATTTTTTATTASASSDVKASSAIIPLEKAGIAKATTSSATTAATATNETTNLKTENVFTTTTARRRDQETSTDFDDDLKVEVVDASTSCDLLLRTDQIAPPRILITTGLLDCFILQRNM